ncbi:hypothetical protein DL769_009416 [Monosporascus sp. CRB-8-3]|nr:hypothetical protein DL769_009416 [Monosporascus sp. CRB-8-3]
MLLEAGASHDHQDVGSYTPLYHYVINAKGDPEDIAELGHILARAGANLEKPKIHGFTPVFRAVEYDNAEAFRTLYRLGAILDVRVDGGTVLHQAAYWGTGELFAALREAVPDLRVDPDLNINRKMGRSAMDALEWRISYGMLLEQVQYVRAGSKSAVPPLGDDEIDAFRALIREIREYHNFLEGRERRYVQEVAPAKAAMPGGWFSNVEEEIDGESDETEDAASDGADDKSCGEGESWETASESQLAPEAVVTSARHPDQSFLLCGWLIDTSNTSRLLFPWYAEPRTLAPSPAYFTYDSLDHQPSHPCTKDRRSNPAFRGAAPRISENLQRQDWAKRAGAGADFAVNAKSILRGPAAEHQH